MNFSPRAAISPPTPCETPPTPSTSPPLPPIPFSSKQTHPPNSSSTARSNSHPPKTSPAPAILVRHSPPAPAAPRTRPSAVSTHSHKVVSQSAETPPQTTASPPASVPLSVPFHLPICRGRACPARSWVFPAFVGPADRGGLFLPSLLLCSGSAPSVSLR